DENETWLDAQRAIGAVQLACGCSLHIDQEGAHPGTPRGNEPLEELIAPRVQPGHYEREDGRAEAPARLDVECPVEEHAQDQVLREVRELADALVDDDELAGSSAREERGEEGEEDRPRPFAREPAAREGPDDACPDRK